MPDTITGRLTGSGTFTGEGSTENQVQQPEGKKTFVADEAKKPVLKPKAEKPADAGSKKDQRKAAADNRTNKALRSLGHDVALFSE